MVHAVIAHGVWRHTDNGTFDGPRVVFGLVGCDVALDRSILDRSIQLARKVIRTIDLDRQVVGTSSAEDRRLTGNGRVVDVDGGERPHIRRRWPGMAGRLLAVHALILTTVLGVVVFRVVSDFTSHYQRTLVRDLTEEVTEYSTAANHRSAGTPLSTFTTTYLQSHVLPSGRVLLIALDHVPAEGSPGSKALFHVPQVSRWLAHEPPSTTIVTSPGPNPFLLLGSTIRVGKTSQGLFVAGVDLARLNAQRRQVLLLAGSEAALALFVALISTYLLLRRVLRTVGRVTEAADEISQGDLDRRLGDQGGDDEVGRLARTFDTMLGRISGAIGSQRRLLSDVSHQLPTPLTVARGHLEVLGRGDCRDPDEVRDTIAVVVDELEHMRILVDQLLLLGRALEPDFIEREPVDLRSFRKAELARRVGVRPEAIRRLLSGHHANPTLSTVMSLASALELDIVAVPAGGEHEKLSA